MPTDLEEAARLLLQAETAREIAELYGGTSLEKTYSPESLRRDLLQFANNKQGDAIGLLRKHPIR